MFTTKLNNDRTSVKMSLKLMFLRVFFVSFLLLEQKVCTCLVQVL